MMIRNTKPLLILTLTSAVLAACSTPSIQTKEQTETIDILSMNDDDQKLFADLFLYRSLANIGGEALVQVFRSVAIAEKEAVADANAFFRPAVSFKSYADIAKAEIADFKLREYKAHLSQKWPQLFKFTPAELAGVEGRQQEGIRQIVESSESKNKQVIVEQVAGTKDPEAVAMFRRVGSYNKDMAIMASEIKYQGGVDFFGPESCTTLEKLSKSALDNAAIMVKEQHAILKQIKARGLRGAARQACMITEGGKQLAINIARAPLNIPQNSTAMTLSSLSETCAIPRKAPLSTSKQLAQIAIEAVSSGDRQITNPLVRQALTHLAEFDRAGTLPEVNVAACPM